jgi:ATP-binding cassette subfamily C protein LapB
LNISRLGFRAGERVALLGPVGSGKSTLLKVLAGLYRPSEGRIRLGGADLWEIEPNVVADHVGYLPQNVHLFKGTLRTNLALSGAVSDSHLLQVSQRLGIDRIAADSPLSMDLEISEGGEGLSGGQRQLVGLGRVFLGQPRIWLLDEPTASLDGESEKQVLQAIQDHLKPEDILLISTHRPALAAKLANRVIIMQRGEVAEDGKPEEVIPRIMKHQSKQVGGAAGRPRQQQRPKMPAPGGLSPYGANKGPANVI